MNENGDYKRFIIINNSNILAKFVIFMFLCYINIVLIYHVFQKKTYLQLSMKAVEYLNIHRGQKHIHIYSYSKK